MAKGDRYVVLTMDKQTGNVGGLSAHIDREVYDAKTDRMVSFRPKSVRDDSRTALNHECIESAKKTGRTQAIWNRLREEGFSRTTSDKEKTDGEKKTRKVKDDAVIVNLATRITESRKNGLETGDLMKVWETHGSPDFFVVVSLNDVMDLDGSSAYEYTITIHSLRSGLIVWSGTKKFNLNRGIVK